MRVKLKKLNSRCYMVVEGLELIDNEVWGRTIKIDKQTEKTCYFHSSWLDRIREVCQKHGYELTIL